MELKIVHKLIELYINQNRNMTIWQISTLLYNAAPVWLNDRTTMSDQ